MLSCLSFTSFLDLSSSISLEVKRVFSENGFLESTIVAVSSFKLKETTIFSNPFLYTEEVVS